MAASRAVLETYELLESILHELQPFELGASLQVCKNWRTIITNSKRIDYTAPRKALTEDGTPCRDDLDLPRYALESPPRFHPALTQQVPDARVTLLELSDIEEIQALQRIPRHEFMSAPPVQAILIQYGDHGPKLRCVRSAGGVKAGHLLHVVCEIQDGAQCENINCVVGIWK